MAIKVDGKVVKAKIKAPRSNHAADEKYTGTEPVWDTERAQNFEQPEFDHHLRRSFQYYNYHYSPKDLKKYVVEWAQESSLFDKKLLSDFIRSPDRTLAMTACSIVMAHRQGMPMQERHVKYLKSAVIRSVELAQLDDVVLEEAKPAEVIAYRPTIQDRMAEKTAETLGEFEGRYDEFLVSKKSFKFYDFLAANNVPQSQLSKYQELIQRRVVELTAASKKTDTQLVEGYSHYKTTDFKRILAFLTDCLTAIEQYKGVKKATKKARVKKAPSKEKVVSKIKYAKEDKTLKLVSINPADIVGATELWIYNTKTRKLGKYVADAHMGTLGVKGTSIVGFDEVKSVCKTLRKPEEKLQEFRKATKPQLRKFLEDVRATETRLNGRISADIVLLKVA
jgi:hypothetical protein